MFKMNRLALSVFVVGASFVGASTSAYAGTSSSNMAVSATVSNVCTISAGALNFPAYDPTSNAVQDGTAAISVTCTSGASATIDLDQGANANTGSTSTAPLRRLKYHDSVANADHFVNYNLFTDSGHTTVWAAGATYNKSYTGTGVLETLTAYAEIPAGQGSGTPAGTYQDTVNATVNF
jgi:spore coat protein U-like protein